MVLESLGWLLQPTCDFSSQMNKHCSTVRCEPIGIALVKRVQARESMLRFRLCIDPFLSMEN